MLTTGRRQPSMRRPRAFAANSLRARCPMHGSSSSPQAPMCGWAPSVCVRAGAWWRSRATLRASCRWRAPPRFAARASCCPGSSRVPTHPLRLAGPSQGQGCAANPAVGAPRQQRHDLLTCLMLQGPAPVRARSMSQRSVRTASSSRPSRITVTRDADGDSAPSLVCTISCRAPSKVPAMRNAMSTGEPLRAARDEASRYCAAGTIAVPPPADR
jgi:hypothetical protein